MKFEECRIGDIVTPKTNTIRTLNPYGEIRIYSTASKKFIVMGLNYGTKTVDIKPVDNEVKELQSVFVLPICLNRTRSDYKLDFEVRREANEISAYYHGVKLATVRCHPDDAYDEEFGLNLLFRRVCQKLKDSHTVVETVEELL